MLLPKLPSPLVGTPYRRRYYASGSRERSPLHLQSAILRHQYQEGYYRKFLFHEVAQIAHRNFHKRSLSDEGFHRNEEALHLPVLSVVPTRLLGQNNGR